MSCNTQSLGPIDGLDFPSKGFATKDSISRFFTFYLQLGVFSMVRFTTPFFSALKFNGSKRKYNYPAIYNGINEHQSWSSISGGPKRIKELKDLVLNYLYHPILMEIAYLILQ